MGLLLSLIGLKTAGIVVANPDTMVSRWGGAIACCRQAGLPMS